ncbi:PDDEXK nuclease domain-containing protein [Chryseobacterium turcicum]|uniref:PDDEXK nuclease domain-containing protein n=1 Tax=Chryseobacterium turcicum TaxID=2898076 RepID=A0A9Q3V638_9FLAO|nr:PDDEXK nuclease domain-containing protein [Chryseobacterium turcicum]MCD1117829.1 PDDEXK nuclease domain-containing protein [Chryseobacterium turcicum]
MKEDNHLSAIDVNLLENIKSIVLKARSNAYQRINRELILTYWEIGKEIVEAERRNDIDYSTSRQIILKLSKLLTKEIGKGFSRSNLFNMRKFYLEYSSVQSPTGQFDENLFLSSIQLTWTHICELLIIEDKSKRSFYEKETVNSHWSIRELKRQIDSSLYERLLLSQGKSNKEKVLELSNKGQELTKAEDILKSPYVFEFLGIPENKPILEKDLERKLIRHIEDFLLELGKGFMFVGSQQRITINNTHYYVDMVFYNKILQCYILIELKTTKLNIADGGQLNTYLNYYKTEVNDENDNPPIGIILCAEKDEITAEYILGGFENNLFASKYITVLPDKQKLIEEVENVMNTAQ